MQKKFLEFNDKKLEPNEFNNRVISYLQIEHSLSLKKIYTRLEDALFPPRILEKYKPKFERHLFPALTVATELNMINDDFINYCAGFISGYSIPILMLDEILDSNQKVNKENLIYIYRSIYKAEVMLSALPNGRKIIWNINNVYDMVTAKLIYETHNRYKIPTNDHLKNYKLSRDPNKYHRSVCGYFSSIVGGVFALKNIILSAKAEELLTLFGILRQLTNEIGDVEEDLKSGIITLPIIFTLTKKPIQPLLYSYWKSETPFQIIENAIQETGAYRSCFTLGINLYNECLKLKNEFVSTYPSLNRLFIFYDLKLCVLYRLEENSWKDNYKKYW